MDKLTLFLIACAAASACDTQEHLGSRPDAGGPTADGSSHIADGSLDGRIAGDGGTAGRDAGVVGTLDPAEVARAGAVLAACLPDDAPVISNNTANDWIHDAYHPRAPQRLRAAIECLATSGGGCDAVARCLGMRVDREIPCERSCEGDTRIDCNTEYRTSIDCTSFGATCAGGKCVPSTPACDGSEAPSCIDGVPTRCGADGHQVRGPRCADLGLQCAIVSGHAVCQGTGADCEHNSHALGSFVVYQPLRCADDDTLEVCAHGKVHRHSCGMVAEGMSCRSSTDIPAACRLGDACTTNASTSCNESSVVVCNEGRTEQVDCATLGFTGCSGGYCTPRP